MRYFLLLICFLVILLIKILPCDNFIKSGSGIHYRATNLESANLIDILRLMSLEIADKLPISDSIKLKNRLENTSFSELMDEDYKILAHNIDKGREISIRIYIKDTKIPYTAGKVIDALFHELAHSLNDTIGHGPDFIEKENMLKIHREFYVNKLIKNTFLSN